ncbi:hypothetical protein A1O3_01375 [Capronia epimyces CBS 606.96]|uniref:Uncharacterized protein n=1 Tax=Capronia epimyces CBS 606.96 TaxID=1182542 RepID=W9YU78_9EURO|nr:uncharacterized protein A1O3_01375 [Capronia epimyces CBS 606.96]EXJ92821.1 hypothetical protein A1O3_01375 [Capronia epimyces CBS 606.96]
MCRCEFHHRRFYFLVHDFAKPEPNFVPAAWFRVVLLSPEYVEGRRRQQQLAADQENEERLTVMDRTEVAKLPLFGRNKCFFQSIDGMVVGKRDHKQERESRKEPTHDLPHEQEHVQDQEREKVQEEGPQDHVFNTWVLLDCGNNEFHMTPIPKPLSWNSDDKSIDNDHAKAEIFTPTGLSATDLVNEATSKGGLAVALQAFVSDGTAKDQHPPLEELKAEGRTYYRRQIRICHENLRAAVDESVTNAYRQRIIWYATLLEYLFMSIQTNEEEFAMINYFDDDSQQEEEDEDGEGSKITAHGDGVAPWEDEDPLEDDSSLDEESDA